MPKQRQGPNLEHMRLKTFLCDRLFHTVKYASERTQPKFEHRHMLVEALNGAEAAAYANGAKAENDHALGWAGKGRL